MQLFPEEEIIVVVVHALFDEVAVGVGTAIVRQFITEAELAADIPLLEGGGGIPQRVIEPSGALGGYRWRRGNRGFGGGFPGLGGGGNMGGMAAMIQQVQKKMYEDAEKMAERLDAARIDGSAGGGSVKSVVDGNGKLMSITIDPSVLEDKDAEMLQDLVLTAVNAALDKAAEQREAEQQKLMPAGLNIPGLF